MATFPAQSHALLDIRDFAIHKRHFQVFIDIELFRSEIYDLVRFAERGLHLIGGLPLLNRLGFSLLRRWRGLLILSLTLRHLSTLLRLGVVADSEQLPDCVLYVARACLGQSSFGEVED